MKSQRGLTLIELVVFIIIVSVGLAGILSAINATVMHSADPVARKQALEVAEAMMDEILAKDFANPPGGFSPATPGNPTQAERSSFDDVDDYNMTGGWSWAGVVKITDLSAVPGLGAYTVTVTVAPAAFGGIAAANAKLVTVSVATGGETIALMGYRTNY